MKILIAEDEPISRIVLERSLKKRGHDVVAVDNGRKAWEVFQKDYFPALISDWTMPEIDGLALCREIRKMPHDNYTYLVLLTAHEGKTKYLEAMEAGVDDFLTKPFDADQLTARIKVAERILGLYRHAAELEGLLSICCSCKKIRDEKNHWQGVEKYIEFHFETRFMQGFCPECYEKSLRDNFTTGKMPQ